MADKAAGGKKRLLELGIVFSSDEEGESDNDDLPQQIDERVEGEEGEQGSENDGSEQEDSDEDGDRRVPNRPL